MQRIYYAATLHKEDIGYSVWVDDIPGCVSQGDNLNEAIENIKEAMGLYYEDSRQRKEEMPAPTAPEKIKLEENETVAMIEFDPIEYMKKHDNKAVKKTLTIPSWLNSIAEAQSINFSSVLQSALKERLDIR